MLLVTLVYDILVPEMSGDVFVRSSLPPQDGPCQVRASCEPRTPGEEGKGEGVGEGEKEGVRRKEYKEFCATGRKHICQNFITPVRKKYLINKCFNSYTAMIISV